jgi:hypothetical protein
MKEPRDSKFWSQIDGVFATMDCTWYGLMIYNRSKSNVLILVFLYRVFYDQDVENHGFEDAVADGVDPVLEQNGSGIEMLALPLM